MPGGDRTGPMGMGAMTGRGAGICAGNTNPGFTNFTMGRGFGRGMGRGMSQGGFGGGRWGGRGGFNFAGRRGSFATGVAYDQVDEKTILVNQEKALKMELDAVKNRLSSMESDSAK
ncbi:MAG: DUF5320 domain-containing protein [Kiritimatiellae bacterium]|jgi:hypothetical protein|nr:DUF5320 domain-containing protein [Kiritimatiellia bacterium]